MHSVHIILEYVPVECTFISGGEEAIRWIMFEVHDQGHRCIFQIIETPVSKITKPAYILDALQEAQDHTFNRVWFGHDEVEIFNSDDSEKYTDKEKIELVRALIKWTVAKGRFKK